MASNPISVLPVVGSDVFELCIFENGKPKYVGYYDDPAAADKYIAEHQSYNIFITPQNLNPSLIQKSHNKMIQSNERTKDSEVLGYRYLLIDLDANQKIGDRIVHRPSGVSASDEEHQAALTLAQHIVREIGLKDENYLLIDSGNGAHIYIPVEEGIQEPAIKAAINGLKTLYDTELVQVDSAVFNPARLMRAPGSINCKGAIKRAVVYMHSPEHLMPVDYKFIAGLKVEPVLEPTQKDKNVNLAKQIADQLGYIKGKRGMYLLKECPFCHSTDNGAVVGKIEPDGGYFFKCHHKRCDGNKWSELKALVGLSTGRL